MGHKNIADYLFDDYIKDTYFRTWVYNPDQEVNTFWNDYLKKNPHKSNDIEKAKLFLSGVQEYYDSNKVADTLVNQKYEGFIAKYPNLKPKKATIIRRNKKRIFNYAAAASIIALIAFSFFYTTPKAKYYTTTYGEYKKIELPDGSQVTLGANSTLRLGEDWSITVDRKVWLEGEAYFNVKPIAATHTKFTVITNDINVEVLGTSFNIDNRKTYTKVILDKGIIKLDIKDSLNQELFLHPGEKITYTSKSRKLPKRQKAKKEETSWKDGVITFSDTALHIVLSKMEDIYGIQLKLEDNSLKDKEVTVAISITDKEVAIATIEKVLGVKFLE